MSTNQNTIASPPTSSAPSLSVSRPSAPAIRIRGLRKSYGAIEAVRGIDLDIQEGEIFGLIGPDGAGKTSTFQTHGGVMTATAAEAIMIATPYLDEAERCTRVGFMHEGLIHQTGTPRELRDHVGLQRLIVRASDLGRAEDLLDETKGIDDAQRFGDHLDVMVKDATAGEKLTRETLQSASIPIAEIKVATPTLENSFVAMLRHVEDEVRATPFPVKRKFKNRPEAAIAIGARDLSKTFGNFEAVKRISLEVKYGEIYGLLGANGAGKTTTIKMLCGLLEPTDGEAELAGETGSLRSSDVRQRVGYMSQKFSLYDDLTIDENLDFFAGVYQVPREIREVRADDPLRAVAILKREMEPWRVSLFGDRLHVIVDGDAQAAARELTARLAREGIRVSEARDDDYTLEDVFLAIVEKGTVAA